MQEEASWEQGAGSSTADGVAWAPWGLWHCWPGQGCRHTYRSDELAPWLPSQAQSLWEWLKELRKTFHLHLPVYCKGFNSSQIKYSQVKCNITAENNISRLSGFTLECKHCPTLEKKSINKNSYKLKAKPYILTGIQKAGDNLLRVSIEKQELLKYSTIYQNTKANVILRVTV